MGYRLRVETAGYLLKMVYGFSPQDVPLQVERKMEFWEDFWLEIAELGVAKLLQGFQHVGRMLVLVIHNLRQISLLHMEDNDP